MGPVFRAGAAQAKMAGNHIAPRKGGKPELLFATPSVSNYPFPSDNPIRPANSERS